MQLMPWQRAFLYISYGWRKRLDGTRRFRRVYLEVAKKNGKTGLAAALSLFHLIADGELSARVFVAATALKQARECFLEAVAMRDKNPDLSGELKKYGASPVLSLFAPETNSRLSPMTRKSRLAGWRGRQCGNPRRAAPLENDRFALVDLALRRRHT